MSRISAVMCFMSSFLAARRQVRHNACWLSVVPFSYVAKIEKGNILALMN